MPDETADQLVRQAAELDAEAFRVGESSGDGRELRRRAAELRVRAIGEKVYPIAICSSCFQITGWTDAAGRCDTCLRAEQRRAAYADPHGGFVDLGDVREPRARTAAVPLRARLAALAGRREGLEQAAHREWLALVDPDETGPISHESGYEIEVARRDQIAAADGSSTILIRFTTSVSRFDGAAWEHLDTTRIRRSAILVPTELSSALPIEQLSEAWGDYGNAVQAFNCTAWRQESERRERQRRAEQDRRDAIADQANIAELLREKA